MPRKQLTLGIFGFGCVGQGLYQALQQSASLPVTVKKICVRDQNKRRSLPAEAFTFAAADLLDDPEINVIVELIDDADAAYHIVTTALKRGKAVVTANKKLVAEHFAELVSLQAEYGVPLLYEAACCASIPVIRNLEEYYDNDLLKGIEGIFNGSSNYILDQVANHGQSYHEALATAQALGFAETDPSLDVEGYDPCYKLSILVAHAFGQEIAPMQIPRFGISSLRSPELRFAQEKGWKLKLVARAYKVGESLHAAVLPQFFQPGQELYNCEAENNAVLLEGAFSQRHYFRGKGAGSLPTGSAVLSDISALGYDYRYEYRKRKGGKTKLELGNFELRIYFRYQDPEVLCHIRFSEIEESYRGQDSAYVIGWIETRQLTKFLAGASSAEVFVAELPDSYPRSVVQEPAELALAVV